MAITREWKVIGRQPVTPAEKEALLEWAWAHKIDPNQNTIEGILVQFMHEVSDQALQNMCASLSASRLRPVPVPIPRVEEELKARGPKLFADWWKRASIGEREEWLSRIGAEPAEAGSCWQVNPLASKV